MLKSPEPSVYNMISVDYNSIISKAISTYSGYPNFKKARDICEKYLDYPVLKWRNLFYKMANQLAEYDGEELIDDTEVMKNKKLSDKQKI